MTHCRLGNSCYLVNSIAFLVIQELIGLMVPAFSFKKASCELQILATIFGSHMPAL